MRALLLLLWLVTAAHASMYCQQPEHVGQSCGLPEGNGGFCQAGSCTATYVWCVGELIPGSGTITSTGATVNGTNTVFTQEVRAGDSLVAGNQVLNVSLVSSDTVLTVVPPFGPDVSGVTFQYRHAMARFINPNDQTFALLSDIGDLTLGSNASGGARLNLFLSHPVSVTSGNGIDLGPFVNMGITGTGERAGDTSAANATAGNGRLEVYASVGGGNATGTNGHGGAPGEIDVETGPGGAAIAAGGVGGAGGVILVNPGPAGAGVAANGAAPVLFLSQFGGVVSLGGFNRDGSDGLVAFNASLGTFPRVAGLTTAGLGVPVTGAKVSLTNQGADIADTNYANGGTSGNYEVAYTLWDTTADVTAGTVTLNVKFNDGTAARTIASTAIVLTSIGAGSFTSGTIPIHLGSGNITYGTTHTGLFGTAKYRLETWLKVIS